MKNINKTMELMANGMTISKALQVVYKTRKVQIPFVDKELNIPVQNAGFTNRACNCFAKTGLTTVLDVINYFDKHNWNSIDSFGVTTATDVFEKLLDITWSKLDTKERAEFLIRVDANNDAREA